MRNYILAIIATFTCILILIVAAFNNVHIIKAAEIAMYSVGMILFLSNVVYLCISFIGEDTDNDWFV